MIVGPNTLAENDTKLMNLGNDFFGKVAVSEIDEWLKTQGVTIKDLTHYHT